MSRIWFHIIILLCNFIVVNIKHFSQCIWMDRLIHPFFVEGEWRVNRSIVSCLNNTAFFILMLSIFMCTFRRSESERDLSESRDEHSPYCRLNHESTDEYIVTSRKEVPFAASRNKVRHILPPVATPSLFCNDDLVRRKRIHRSALQLPR